MVHSCVAALALLTTSVSSRSDYDAARAEQFAKFAGAAYCSQKSLEAWSCGEKCSADVSNVTVCNGAETKAFVGMWEGKCLVSFEGTSNVAAFIKDLEVLKKAVSWDGCEACKVHGGFLDEYKSLEQCLKIVLAGTGCPTGSEIRTTGHSLGAAVNSIAMMDLSDAGWIIKESYDFGKPRVGDSNFAAAHNDLLTGKVWRVTHAKDPVPQVPPEQTGGIVDWHFEHVEPEIFYKGKVAGGFQKCTDAACKGRCAEQYWNVPLDLLFVGDHLDYMGQKTSPFGCRNSEPNETVAEQSTHEYDLLVEEYNLLIANETNETVPWFSAAAPWWSRYNLLAGNETVAEQSTHEYDLLVEEYNLLIANETNETVPWFSAAAPWWSRYNLLAV